MRLWFKKQDNAQEPVPAKEGEPAAIPAADLARQAVPAPATPQNAALAAASAQAAPNVPVRPKMGQKALYYQMMNSIYDAVLILDDNGHVVDCNERVPSILGHSREELWDEPVGTLMPGITPQIFAKMKSSLHGNRRVLISARCHRKDGSTFHAEVGAGLMSLAGENLVLTVRNIEKRAPVKAIVRRSG
ncbi:MAG: PAS domain-containing protein [Kiritimatiellae bacterium]|nr:PAS domain-containing protein [Kiritimatiellia bacterium]